MVHAEWNRFETVSPYWRMEATVLKRGANERGKVGGSRRSGTKTVAEAAPSRGMYFPFPLLVRRGKTERELG
jgi:hypothetical protein